MARLGGLDRDVGCLEVADLADHDDVGILAQEGLQGDRKGRAGLVIDVDLIDAGQVDFRWILDGGNVHTGLVQDVQTGVERDGLARSGRACHKHHAVRSLDRQHQAVLFDFLVAQRVDAQLGRRWVKNPDDDLLAEQGGQGADAEVDGAIAELELHAAVLGHALLGNVQTTDDLDA